MSLLAGDPLGLGGSAPLLAEWHEFYMLAGTAAATLAGLLFVSLSFNLEVLLHDRHAHLLAYARQTLMEFVFAITISLVFLVPHITVRPLGAMLAASAVAWLAFGFVGRRHAQRRAKQEHDDEVPARRRLAGMLAMALIALAGLEMLLKRSPDAAYIMIGAICLLLGNAAGSSWHLLVEVGKLKTGRARGEGSS